MPSLFQLSADRSQVLHSQKSPRTSAAFMFPTHTTLQTVKEYVGTFQYQMSTHWGEKRTADTS